MRIADFDESTGGEKVSATVAGLPCPEGKTSVDSDPNPIIAQGHRTEWLLFETQKTIHSETPNTARTIDASFPQASATASLGACKTFLRVENERHTGRPEIFREIDSRFIH